MVTGKHGLYLVFSTYVEVILFAKDKDCCALSILHVCGGDPHLPYLKYTLSMYSPRMWR